VITQAHAAKPKGRYLQPAGPQRPLLQGVIHARNRTTVHCWRERRFAASSQPPPPAAPPDTSARGL
jgi:hypothetical protein